MANFKFLTVTAFAVLVSLSTVASAGYQTMRPPPGWNPGNPTTYKPAPGEFYDLDKKTWMTMGSANIGGRELTVPVALPLSTGLSVGLAVASAFSSNPAILLGTIAWGLYQTYLSQKRITPNEDGTFTKVVDGIECASNCFEYQQPNTDIWHRSLESACQAGVSTALTPNPAFVQTYAGVVQPGTCVYAYRWGSTDMGTGNVATNLRSIPPWTTATSRLASPTEVATDMQNTPMPKPLVEALPMPLPVGQPTINPGTDGNPQVLRVPQGSPVAQPLPNPNPDNLPQTWKTPVVDLIPSPTPDDPWRLESIPKNIIKTIPAPLPDPFNPDPTTTPTPTPVTDPDATETPSEQTPGLCDLYPDILACKKFDEVPDSNLDTINKNVMITPESGWGSGAGACPQTKTITVQGRTIPIPLDLICQYMQGLRPIIISMAWLSAGFILLGSRGGD